MESAFGITHIAFILFFAFLGGWLLQRLRQPALIGYIVVGAIVGPGLLGLQANDPTLQWLAELAIIFLMFMLGLELDISRFAKGMRAAVWVTTLQILAGLAVMVSAAILFDWPLQLGIILGFAIALSSTAVAVSMLRDLRETNSSAGRLATANLIAQDIAVVPMLLVVGAFHEGTVNFESLIRLSVALGTIALSLLAIFRLQKHPEIIAKVERILNAGAGQPVVAGMALCFGAAALSGALGLSTAYGAFALGLLIGNIGTIGASYRHAIHPIHDFLMMLFFLSIGLLLDFVFIFKNIFVIATLLGITILLKTIFNVFLFRLLGTPVRTAYTLGAVLGQIGEFSFVLVALGLSSGFISHDGYRIALAVIALSLALSPLSLQIVRHYLDPDGHIRHPAV
ncbi:MAG: cation:proton antiporter [Patescibacteria group bacterium]